MRNRWLRRAAYALAGLVTVVVAALLAVYTVTSARARATFDVAALPVPVAHDSTTIARGAHLVTAIGKCAECHGADFGGKVFIDDPALGRVVSANLTAGGKLAQYTDAEFARAIRNGVNRDGHGLYIMPSRDYAAFSDEDVGAVIAYLRSVPAVSHTLPATNMKLLARVLWATNQLPLMDAFQIDHAKRPPQRVAVAPTKEYGHYLADVGGCTGCHGPGLSGGKIPGTPPDWKPAANITPSGNIGKWSEGDFTQALRTGRRPDGSPIDTLMPWKAAGQMSDDEIRAVYAFLKSVPAKAYGNR